MAKSIIIVSIALISLTLIWLVYALATEPLRWQFLAAGAVHFIASIIVNKQMTYKNYNYLGIAHTTLTVLLFGYGYIVL